MSDIIKLLPDSIANQIAAGEVVQRPASAVKELLENAVDAGAKKVELSIKDGGKTLIRVIDDGAGMSVLDARMCFERHATSKIKASGDLFNIRTKGFRGEAMASIAAIAQVELKTRRAEDDLGTEVEIAGSEIRHHRSCASPKGTSVSIRNLFFNVPARRNFLKSTASETKYVVNEFLRVALAHPEVNFRFEHQDALVYDLPAADMLNRILQVFGFEAEDDLIKVEEHTPYVSITGYISKPQSARRIRGDQFFFVNDRYIKDGYLNHAIMSAYEDTLKKDEYPLYVLYLNLEPRHIDINIHPTKTEIKFDDQQGVYALLRSSVRKALGMFHLNPELQNLNFGGPGLSEGDTSRDTTLRDFSRNQSSRIRPENWEALFGPSQNKSGSTLPEPDARPVETLFRSAADQNLLPEVPDVSFWILHQRYILLPVSQGICVVDPHAARERILYEQYVKSGLKSGSAPQLLLYPQTLLFSVSDVVLLHERAEMIRSAGFDIREFGKNTWLLSALPPEIRPQDAKEILDAFLSEPDGGSTPADQLQEKLARSIAKSGKLSADFMQNQESVRKLIHQWQQCENPGHSPDGRLISWILSLEEIGKRFR